MKFLLSVGLLLGLLCSLAAQQLPKVYNQFFMNPYIYNPAYAGVEGHTVLFFMYKSQWGNLEGAPTYLHANFHVPLKGGIAFGALVENQTEGLLSSSAGKISAGYLVTLDREHFLRFGMSLGAGNFRLNFDEFDSPNDPAFGNFMESSSFMTGDFGAPYHFGHFNVGFSLPQLFSYDLISENSFAPIRVTPLDNILFKMNYRGHINDDVAIEPHLIYRYSNVLPSQFEATVIFHVYHVVWIGGSYRQDAGGVGLLGFKIKEKIGVGYSYEMGNPNISSLLGPSHEVHIGYHLGTKKEHAAHVSSFIKSHRKSAEERAREAELERQRKLQALQRSREQTSGNEDELSIVSQPTPKEEPRKDNPWSYEKEESLVERVNENGERELGVKFDRINAQGETEVVFSWLPPPPSGVATETYEIANPNEAPLERRSADGTKEIGVKWIRTLDNGETETLIVWDPILSSTQADAIDHNPSQALGLSDAKIVINNEYIEENPIIESQPIERDIPSQVDIQEETNPTVDPGEFEESTITESPEEAIVQNTSDDRVITSPQVIEEIEKGDPDLTTDFRTHEELAESDIHMEVKRGNHLLELPIGNHVIAGAFESFQHAEDYSDELFQRGFHDTIVGYVSARGYYYVVIYQSTNLATAQKEKNRVKGLSGLSKVWVLKVN